MNPTVKAFLEKERVCGLTILQQDGSLHSAAMHFSLVEEPFQLYFSTDITTRKGSKVANEPTKAAFTIGFSEEEWKTLQIEGDIRVATDEEVPAIKEVHYSKNPGSKKFEGDPNTRFLILTPTWWRYTDFMKDPLEIIAA
ncbi:MAG: pyridoxamine 5'-phosphate oxidase family protein [Candidatus Dojkabacteria bacterium]|nr:MAG: pyridoxamine 5'-phosphate oxidase family protein [Candidatus Dojkabacteria bacterium]